MGRILLHTRPRFHIDHSYEQGWRMWILVPNEACPASGYWISQHILSGCWWNLIMGYSLMKNDMLPTNLFYAVISCHALDQWRCVHDRMDHLDWLNECMSAINCHIMHNQWLMVLLEFKHSGPKERPSEISEWTWHPEIALASRVSKPVIIVAIIPDVMTTYEMSQIPEGVLSLARHYTMHVLLFIQKQHHAELILTL